MKSLANKFMSASTRTKVICACITAAIVSVFFGARHALANKRGEGFVDSGGASVRA